MNFLKIKLFIINFLFLTHLTSLSWSSNEQMIESNFSFEIPARLKHASSSNQEHNSLERALDALSVKQREQSQPSIPVNHIKGSYKNEWFSITSNHFDQQINNHIFAVANFTLQMFTTKIELSNWKSLPLNIIKGDKSNTAYHWDSSDKKIKFYGQEIRDFDYDVIAHEVGHAVLDYLNPGLNRSPLRCSNPKIKFQLQVLHEAFGDITSVLSSFYLANSIVDSQFTASLLSNPLKIQALAPCYQRNELGLRNPALPHNYKLYLKENKYHDFSQMITSSIQNSIYSSHKNWTDKNSENSSQFNQDFTKNIRLAFINTFNSKQLIIDNNVLQNFVNLMENNFGSSQKMETLKQSIKALFKD